MKAPVLLAILSALTLLGTNDARACGRDFFLCDPSSLPPGLATLLLPTFRWDRDGGQDEFEFSTGIVHPLTSRIAFDGYVSFTDDQGGWETESIVPGLLFDLTPDATGVRYEFREDVGGSIEAIGYFQVQGKHQVFANVWWEPTEGFVLRSGVGVALTERTEDFTLLTGLVLEF